MLIKWDFKVFARLCKVSHPMRIYSQPMRPFVNTANLKGGHRKYEIFSKNKIIIRPLLHNNKKNVSFLRVNLIC